MHANVHVLWCKDSLQQILHHSPLSPRKSSLFLKPYFLFHKCLRVDYYAYSVQSQGKKRSYFYAIILQRIYVSTIIIINMNIFCRRTHFLHNGKMFQC